MSNRVDIELERTDDRVLTIRLHTEDRAECDRLHRAVVRQIEVDGCIALTVRPGRRVDVPPNAH